MMMSTDTEHRRWNVQGRIDTMEKLREAVSERVDPLNWLVPYSFFAIDSTNNEVSVHYIGKKCYHDGKTTVLGHFEGYAIMPRVGGCSKVDLTIDTPEDALFVVKAIVSTMTVLNGNAGEACNNLFLMDPQV